VIVLIDSGVPAGGTTVPWAGPAVVSAAAAMSWIASTRYVEHVF
jgi:hypothetical protein